MTFLQTLVKGSLPDGDPIIKAYLKGSKVYKGVTW